MLVHDLLMAIAVTGSDRLCMSPHGGYAVLPGTVTAAAKILQAVMFSQAQLCLDAFHCELYPLPNNMDSGRNSQACNTKILST